MEYNKELQIQINDVYACPGHCPGCTLTALERKTSQPDMPATTLINTYLKLSEYLLEKPELEMVNVTYGIADHLLMSNEYLEFTFHMASDFLKSIPNPSVNNAIFYSTSMIGKTSFIEEKLNLFKRLKEETGQNVYMLAVIDPKNLYHKSFGKTYSQNIALAQKMLGDVDLSINMSIEALDKISAEALFEFAQENHFGKININWTPTKDNLDVSYMDQTQFLDWLIRFDKLVATTTMETSYRPVLLKTINALKCKDDEFDSNIFESLKAFTSEAFHKHLHFDEKGHVYSHFEGIGDAAHNPRFGYAPAGSVLEDKPLSQILHQYAEESVYDIFKEYLKEPCLDCQYNVYCANSGFHVYNKILSENMAHNPQLSEKIKKSIEQNGCPHTGKGLFSYYEKIAHQLYDLPQHQFNN